jgi:hypothetical protein
MTSIRVAAFSILAGLLLFGSRSASGAEVRLDTAPDCLEQHVELASLPGGGFVAVWLGSAVPGSLNGPRVFARVFGPAGAPLGAEFQVNGDADAFAPAVAANVAGDFLVVWGEVSVNLRSRLFHAGGDPSGPVRTITPVRPAGDIAVVAEAGGFAVLAAENAAAILWRLDAGGELRSSRVFQADTPIPEGPFPQIRDAALAYGPSGLVALWEITAGVVALEARGVDDDRYLLIGYGSIDPQRLGGAIAMGRTGRILVAWREVKVEVAGGASSLIRAQLFDASGQALGAPFRVDDGDWLALSEPDVASDGAGGFVVTWRGIADEPATTGAAVTQLRRVGALGGAVGGILAVSSNAHSGVERPALAVDAGGRVTVAWQAGAFAVDGPSIPTCTSQGIYARQLAPLAAALPLQQSHFEVGVRWTDHAGQAGEGKAVALTADSGYFWFFGPDNLELMVKVLDGRAVNGHYWVFYGTLSDVAYTLTVTNTFTGTTRTYVNPSGQLASRADTSAFPDDSAGVPASAALMSVSADLSQGASAAAAGPCSGAPTGLRRPGLCLGSRFEVEVSWHAEAAEGIGREVRLTGDSGYFWFFGPNNIELVVKVLDGTAVNGHFWVFYGALSNVDYTVLVRDTATGAERTYHNPAGQLASRADTTAF